MSVLGVCLKAPLHCFVSKGAAVILSINSAIIINCAGPRWCLCRCFFVLSVGTLAHVVHGHLFVFLNTVTSHMGQMMICTLHHLDRTFSVMRLCARAVAYRSHPTVNTTCGQEPCHTDHADPIRQTRSTQFNMNSRSRVSHKSGIYTYISMHISAPNVFDGLHQ